MSNLRPFDRRREARAQFEIEVMVWGVDTRGERFVQQAAARNISLGGALFCGIEAELRSGDVIGVLYRGKKARYRVVWVRYQEGLEKRVAIHRMEPDICPWQELLAQSSSSAEESSEIVRFPSDWH